MLFQLGWYGTHLLIPLLPFFLGFLIRCAVYGGVGVQCVGLAELSISMAALAILMLAASESSTSKTDPELTKMIRPVLWVMLGAFICFFAVACYLDASVEASVPGIIELRHAPLETRDELLAVMIGKLSADQTPVPLLRLFALFCSGINLVSTVVVKERLNLTD